MKTVFANSATVRGDWFVVDATDKTLGRLATQLAHRLKGKHKADYSPHVDMGDHLVVLNAQKVRVTGRKLDRQDVLPPHRLHRWHQSRSPSTSCSPSTRSARSSLRSRACCRRARSDAACSRSCTCSAAQSTRHQAQQPKPLEIQ